VELEVPNRDQSMRNGVTADVHIPLEPVSGHRFSAGLLTLDDAGAVGVRAVTEGDIVRFLPVRILDQGKDGVFVAGLPREVTIITAGQDYVVDGQKVEAVPDGTAANESERKAGGADGRS
jgi:multidrug efflux system membrane fusion protein